MSTDQIWEQIRQNVQRVAEANELVQPGETFELTDGQVETIDTVMDRLRSGESRVLIKAPTGSGKTECALRIAISRTLDTKRPVVMLCPTRDLARQQHDYFASRIDGTGLRVVEMHGGIPPRQRSRTLDEIEAGKIQFVVGSAMLLQHRRYRSLLEGCALLVIDDVNAFDEEEDLAHIRGLRAQVLFMSATPEAVDRFLKREGAWDQMVVMTQMPFDSPPTQVHEIGGKWNENVFNQLDMGMEVLRHHIEAGSRIYVISRTRARVPVMAKYVEDRTGVPVSMLHGEMADSSEHRRRMQGKVAEDRISMMRRFRENKPAILVATNLVGSGLDIPMADMVLITDSDHFGVAEKEQLLGRVGRRERESDAVLITGTIARHGAVKARVKASSYVRHGRVVLCFRPRPAGRKKYIQKRVV